MPRPLPLRASMALLASMLLAAPGTLRAEVAVELQRARQAIERRDGKAAVTALESALVVASATERPAILNELRMAYDLAARQAEAEGNERLASSYRDNLAILNRASAPKPAKPATPLTTEPKVADGQPEPTDERDSVDPDFPSLEADPFAPLRDPNEPQAETNVPQERMEPEQIAPPQEPTIQVADADAAFRSKKYLEAGRLYGLLAAQGRLPESRHDHYAYCRCVAVVQRINAHPRSKAEWDQIHAEIQKIKELAPRNWFGEYLRDLATQRASQLASASAQPSQFVVRGASPDDQPLTVSDNPAPAQGDSQNLGTWQIEVTPSFRILHVDPELAEQVARAAEVARNEQTKRWGGSSPDGNWTPKCDIYLYPNAKIFTERTGQPEDSPGFSTMGLSNGRVVARRINLRADAPNLVEAVLPHEVTHVVLADLFPTMQIPRWADEGMAVLAEPPSEQDACLTDLIEPLSSGRLFKLETLLTTDYPDGRYWPLYFAQSVSVTRYLVELEGHERFIAFLQAAQRSGFESELRRVYQIDGYLDLQNRWLAHARRQVDALSGLQTATGESRTRRD